MSELTVIEQQMDMHKAEMQRHALEFCKLVAQIAEGGIWRTSTYPSFRFYMFSRWNIGKSQAYEMWKIGRNVNNSENTENLTITQLSALANVKPQFRAATIEALERLPADKITAASINRLSDVIEAVITTGAVEVSEGNQIRLDQLDALESGLLLELVESRKRQLEHVSGKRQAPTASFSGYSLNECLQNPLFLNLPSATPSSVEIYDRGESVRVVISLMKSGERV